MAHLKVDPRGKMTDIQTISDEIDAALSNAAGISSVDYVAGDVSRFRVMIEGTEYRVEIREVTTP